MHQYFNEEFKKIHWNNSKYCENVDLAMNLLSIHMTFKNIITIGNNNLCDIKLSNFDFLCTKKELFGIYKEIILMLNFYYPKEQYIEYKTTRNGVELIIKPY